MVKALLIGGASALRSHFLEGLESLRPQSAWTVVSSACAGRQLAAQASPGFDLVVVDLSVGDADAAVLLVDLHSASPVRPIVALPAADRRTDVLNALQLGAAGVVPRDASAGDVVFALRTVLEGGVYMPARLVRAATGADGGEGGRPVGLAAVEPAAADLSRLGLTSRQTEVLAMLLRGHSNKAIARELHLSVETIKDHVAAVLRGLSVRSRTQAVLAVEQLLRQAARPRLGVPTLQSAWQPAVAPSPDIAASAVR